LVAVDGKAIRRSFAHAWDASGMAHLVSAFVDANRVVFAQVATDAKSNEIEAIPRLLALLDLSGATVAADATGCQTGVARQVVDAGGHDVLAVKDNQRRPAVGRVPRRVHVADHGRGDPRLRRWRGAVPGRNRAGRLRGV
jgi:hypothetical protein